MRLSVRAVPRRAGVALELPGWLDDVACTPEAAGLFFPPDGDPGDEAKAICRSCPSRVACLESVLDDPSVEGIFGGFTERSRRRVVRERAAGRPLEDIIAASDVAADQVRASQLARDSGVTDLERNRARQRNARRLQREARTATQEEAAA